MADNLTITPGAGATVHTDDIGGVHVQRVKAGFGVDGSYGDVTPANPLPVAEAGNATATLSSVTAAAASTTTLLASRSTRVGASFYNDSTAVLKLAYAATASGTAFTVAIAAGGFYELPRPAYTGAISGIWAAANGAVRITEVG